MRQKHTEMRKTIITFAIGLVSLAAFGQTALTQAQQQQIIAKIDKSATSVQTLQCHFTQVKSMALMKSKISSEGTMYFKKPSKLHWQYTKPYDYSFILNGSKAYMKSAKSTTTVDVNKNKMFRQISDVIMNCMIGGNLSKTSYFKVAIYKSGNTVYANLTPVKKELKQLYSLITLYFNQSLTMVTKVEMKEKNGDKTVITLSDIKINGSINEKVFSCN